MNHGAAEKLRLETAHFYRVRFALLMIEAEKVQKAVREKQIQLFAKCVTVLFRLRARAIEGNHYIAQPPRWNLGIRAHGAGKIAKFVVGKLRERKHIGGFVFPAPIAVEHADVRIVGEEDRKLSFF